MKNGKPDAPGKKVHGNLKLQGTKGWGSRIKYVGEVNEGKKGRPVTRKARGLNQETLQVEQGREGYLH